MFKRRNVCVAVLASALLSGCAGAGIGLSGGSPEVRMLPPVGLGTG